MNLPNTISNGDNLDASPVQDNFVALESAINDADGANLIASSVPDSALVNNPTTIRSEIIADFVASGLASSVPVTSLTAVIGSGIAYIKGVRVVANSFTHAFTASQDCYVDLDENGDFHVTEVANGAGVPALYTNSTRICKFVSGTVITAYTDLRILNSTGGSKGSNFLWMSGILIQWGTGLVGASGGAGSVNTFPIAFDSAPSVNFTVSDPGTWIGTLLTAVAASFTAKSNYSGGDLACQYIAIGPKALKP